MEVRYNQSAAATPDQKGWNEPFDETPTVLFAPGAVFSILIDLDRDGLLDILSVLDPADVDDDAVRFFRQSANGTFEIATLMASDLQDPSDLKHPLLTSPSAVAAGDIDRDGDTDIAVASTSRAADAAGLIVFTNTDGAFSIEDAERHVLTEEHKVSRPTHVELADVDGDGALDLTMTNLKVLRGDKDKIVVAFQVSAEADPVEFDVVSIDDTPLNVSCDTRFNVDHRVRVPMEVAVADLNGDGLQDLVTANRFSSNATVFFQGPEIRTFRALEIELDARFTLGLYSLAVGDLDSDGDLDVVTANEDSNTLSTFFQRPRTPDDAPPTELKPDCSNHQEPTILLGLDSVFDADPQRSFNEMFIESPMSVRLADIDADGALDVVAAGAQGIGVFFRDGPGVFSLDSRGLISMSDGVAVASADLDHDGDNDLVFAQEDGQGLSVLYQQTPGNYTGGRERISDNILNASDVAVGHLNDDRFVDLVTVSKKCSSVRYDVADGRRTAFQCANADDETKRVENELLIYFQREQPRERENNGNRTLQWFSDADRRIPLDHTPISVAIADVNGDGHADVLSANGANCAVDCEGSEVRVLFQSASEPGTFPESTSIPLPSLPTDLSAGDVDGDGRIDFAVTLEERVTLQGETSDLRSVHLYFQKLDGSFEEPHVLTGYAESVQMGDLNNDGLMDLVSVREKQFSILVAFQTSPRVFMDVTELPGLSDVGPVAIALGDLDGDNDTDIAATFRGSDRVAVYLQARPGVLELRQELFVPGATGPEAITITDADDDTDLDIVTANLLGDTITVFFGGH